jgi:hypothetical protein
VIEQVLFGPRLVAEQLSAVFVNAAAPEPAIDTLKAAVALPPLFLSSNVLGVDDDPGATVPKSQLAGVKESDGGLAAPAPAGPNSPSTTTAAANSDAERFIENNPFLHSPVPASAATTFEFAPYVRSRQPILPPSRGRFKAQLSW